MNNIDLTPAMQNVLDAYLAEYVPSETYDENIDRLISTDIIIGDLLGSMDFEFNPVGEYLYEKGFRYFCNPRDGIHGWIMRPVSKLLAAGEHS